MSDWGDEETTTTQTGRSFGGNNFGNTADNDNDDEWGAPPSGSGGGNNNDDDRGDRNGGRGGRGRGGGRGGRGGGGRGGGRSYNNENGDDGGFPRRRRDNDDENGTINENIVERSEYFKQPRVIPQDYEKETILKFMQELPKLRKVANLVEMYCIQDYIKKAYDMYLNQEDQQETQRGAAAADSRPNVKKSTFFVENTLQESSGGDVVEEQQQQQETQTETDILSKQRQEFMHNLIFQGREKEAELSQTRRAQVNEERQRANEIFWRKKFQAEPRLRSMLEGHYDRRDRIETEGFETVLNNLQSDRYEITVGDLEYADRRRLGLLKPNERQRQLRRQSRHTFGTRDEMTSSGSGSQQSDENEQFRHARPRRIRNIPENFMRLRSAVKRNALPSILSTNKPIELDMKYKSQGFPIELYRRGDDKWLFKPIIFDNTAEIPSSFAHTRDEMRDAETTPMNMSSFASVNQRPLEGASAANSLIRYPEFSRNISQIPDDLPHHVHQTEFEAQSFNPTSTPEDGVRRRIGFVEELEALEPAPTSLIAPTRNADDENPPRLTIISERDSEQISETPNIIENNDLIPPIQSVIRQGVDENNDLMPPIQSEIRQGVDEITEVAVTTTDQLAITENQNVPAVAAAAGAEQPQERSWFNILRSRNVEITYNVRDQVLQPRRRRRPNRNRNLDVPPEESGDRSRNRSRRRTTPIPPQQEYIIDELPSLIPANNLALLPPPPIPFGADVDVEDREQRERAQERHEQFLFNNIEPLREIMASEYNIHDMMLEYIEVSTNADPNRFYKNGPLLSGFTFDPSIILDMDERELELKIHLTEELVKNPSVNVDRLREIRNRNEAVEAFAFLTQLKDFF